MVASYRQFVLASALLAAVWLLGSATARAGYVPVAAWSERDGIGSLTPLAEDELPAATIGSSAASQPQPNTEDTPVPSEPFSPLEKLLPDACNFGHGSSAGSSSSSASGHGPSTPPAGEISRPQVPPLESTSILPPLTGDAHTFSVASFLFRPPRQA